MGGSMHPLTPLTPTKTPKQNTKTKHQNKTPKHQNKTPNKQHTKTNNTPKQHKTKTTKNKILPNINDQSYAEQRPHFLHRHKQVNSTKKQSKNTQCKKHPR